MECRVDKLQVSYSCNRNVYFELWECSVFETDLTFAYTLSQGSVKMKYELQNNVSSVSS